MEKDNRAATQNIIKMLSTDDIHDLLIKFDLNTMSEEIFGIPYKILKTVIYPAPTYKTFLIAKRKSGFRIINEPKRKLKILQEKLLTYLYKNSGEAKKCVHGFTPKRSIVTNASQHCSPKTHHLLNLDIQEFFPSINFYRVRGLFMSRPFGFSYNTATVLAQICCYKNSLPQGAPTSPILANLVCRSLDKQLMELAHRHRAIYTRYSDDITFSFSVKQASRLPNNICAYDSGVVTLGDELLEIFKNNTFSINPNKTRLSNPRHRLEVTGLTINSFPNVKRKYIDEIRGALHAWEKFGYVNANEQFQAMLYKRKTRSSTHPGLNNYIKGKLLFLKMVRGKDDVIYTKLAEKFNHLNLKESAKESSFKTNKLPILPVVRNKNDAERAVFVIECSADHPVDEAVSSQGTAFYLGESEFITCEHAIRYKTDYFDSLPNGEILLLDAKTKKEWKAKIVYKDPTLDLAILQSDDFPKHSYRYFSLSETPINNSQKGFIIGFPNYSYGKSTPIHIETEVIGKYNRHALSRIEISEQIRMGNSGGPFVDNLYRVVGVIQQGATINSSNNECLNVTELKKWLDGYKTLKSEEINKSILIAKLSFLLTKYLSVKKESCT